MLSVLSRDVRAHVCTRKINFSLIKNRNAVSLAANFASRFAGGPTTLAGVPRYTVTAGNLYSRTREKEFSLTAAVAFVSAVEENGQAAAIRREWKFLLLPLCKPAGHQRGRIL